MLLIGCVVSIITTSYVILRVYFRIYFITRSIRSRLCCGPGRYRAFLREYRQVEKKRQCLEASDVDGLMGTHSRSLVINHSVYFDTVKQDN